MIDWRYLLFEAGPWMLLGAALHLLYDVIVESARDGLFDRRAARAKLDIAPALARAARRAERRDQDVDEASRWGN